MATVEVHHQDLVNGGTIHVATVTIPDDVTNPLEYAWRWTNNINGSWSRRDIPNNSDANEMVKVIAPPPVDKHGVTWGLRSSMLGDTFILDGVPHLVAVFGFVTKN